MSPASAYAHALARTTVTADGCWLWQGATCSKGYGHVKVGGRNVLLHRLAVIVRDGRIPPRLTVDHRCHDAAVCPGGRSCPHRRCVNPSHLAVVTRGANVRRAARQRRERVTA